MPNLCDYQLLMDEMRDYFSDGFLDADQDRFAETLKNNEPKRGKDFQLWTADSDDEESGETSRELHNELLENIQNAFESTKTYKNDFGWNTDSDSDATENCVKIKNNQQTPFEDCKGEDKILKTFSAALLTDKDVAKNLTHAEILERLADPETLSNLDDFWKLPNGVLKFMRQFPLFRNQFDEVEIDVEMVAAPPPSPAVSTGSSNKENVNKTSSLGVPSFSSAPSTPKSLNYQLRSSNSLQLSLGWVSASRAAALAKASTPSRQARSKKRAGSVTTPSTNARMEKFVRNFIGVKRRRDSISPK